MSLEIGDEATPIRNITQLETTYETAGETGIVTNRTLLFLNENDQEIYTYQVTFNAPIQGLTSSGTPAEPLSLFWFSSEELGQETIEIEPFDFNEVNNNLNEAKSISQVAINVIGSIANTTQSDDALADTIFELLDSADTTNEALLNSNFNDNDQDIREQQASAANFNALDLQTNQEIFQEIAENIAGLHDVQREVNQELAAQTEQTREQTSTYYVSKEEDHINYMAALANTNTSLPVGSVYDLKETDWAEALAPPLTINIVPEVED